MNCIPIPQRRNQECMSFPSLFRLSMENKEYATSQNKTGSFHGPRARPPTKLWRQAHPTATAAAEPKTGWRVLVTVLPVSVTVSPGSGQWQRLSTYAWIFLAKQ
jgi:hypothetical protein